MKYVLTCIIAAIGTVTIASTALADQNDERLDSLFGQLQNAPDSETAQNIEIDIWRIWLQYDNEDVNALMLQGIQAMTVRNLKFALESFDRVTELAPNFAEGWNKRATVHYLMDHLDESVQDIQRTLALEPRHFGALSGMGLIFMQLGDDEGALNAYEEVIKLYPNAPSAQHHIQALRTKLYRDAI